MDYIDSETEEPDDLPYLETEYGMPPPLAAECKSFKWKIEVIDTAGKIEGKMITSKEVWKIQSESRESKLWFNDPPMRKVFVMNALGSRCKDVKLRLWKEYKRNSLSETLLNRPENVPENQWGHFVHMRFTEKWKKMQERNIESQKKNIMPHVLGRKRFSKKRNDMTIKTGKRPCRAEFFFETRTKPNGSFVCEEAKTRTEELTTLLGQKSHVTNNAIASLDDEYAQVFGPERPGRVQFTSERLLDQVKGMTTFIQQVIGTSTGQQLLPTYQFHQIQIRNGVMMMLETKTQTLEAMAVIFINISLITTFNLFYFMNLHDGLVDLISNTLFII
ncbi:unnamed protein product [Brassica oleracea]